MRISLFSICIFIICPVLIFLLKGRKLVVENVVEWKVMDACDAKSNNNVFLWNNSSLWMFSVPAFLFKLDHLLNKRGVELYTGSAMSQNCSRHVPNVVVKGNDDMVSLPHGGPMKYGRTNLFSSFSELKSTQNNTFFDSAPVSTSTSTPYHPLFDSPGNGSILSNIPTNISLKKMPSTYRVIMINI